MEKERERYGLDNLMEIHDTIRSLALMKNFVGMNEYIGNYIPADSDISEQRTVLVATKSFRDWDEIKYNRKKVLESLEKKIGKIK